MNMKKKMMLLLLVAGTLLLYGAGEPAERSDTATLTAEQMVAEVSAKSVRVAEIEATLKKMQDEAVNEKDIKWKLCLDDIFATIRGIMASIQNANTYMDNLSRAGKQDALRTQLLLVRGLADAAEKAIIDAQSCPRQLTRVDNRSITEKEQKKDLTGTHGEKDSLGDAMGQDFTTAWASERDPNDLGTEDPVDGAGTDTTGGPTETPGHTGGEPDSISEHGDIISTPPFVEPSPEK